MILTPGCSCQPERFSPISKLFVSKYLKGFSIFLEIFLIILHLWCLFQGKMCHLAHSCLSWDEGWKWTQWMASFSQHQLIELTLTHFWLLTFDCPGWVLKLFGCAAFISWQLMSNDNSDLSYKMISLEFGPGARWRRSHLATLSACGHQTNPSMPRNTRILISSASCHPHPPP